MKVKTILKRAGKCKTDDDVDGLFDLLHGEFSKHFRLGTYNHEALMEDGAPFVGFEIIREINDHYATKIRPMVRDGALVVVVGTDYFKDGRGLASQNYEQADGLDEAVIEAYDDQTVKELCEIATDLAIADHRLLIERVGVPESIARETAKKCW
jgi:hypothetical protein